MVKVRQDGCSDVLLFVKRYSTMRRMPITLLFALIMVWLWACSAPSEPLLTGLERSNYQQLTRSMEIDGFLTQLSGSSPLAEVVSLGTSARGVPINGLLVSRDLERFRDATNKSRGYHHAYYRFTARL